MKIHFRYSITIVFCLHTFMIHRLAVRSVFGLCHSAMFSTGRSCVYLTVFQCTSKCIIEHLSFHPRHMMCQMDSSLQGSCVSHVSNSSILRTSEMDKDTRGFLKKLEAQLGSESTVIQISFTTLIIWTQQRNHIPNVHEFWILKWFFILE